MDTMLTPEERETVISMIGDNHETWLVYSDDPYWQRRMEKLGIEPERIVGGGRHYRLTADMVLIRKGKRQLSEQTRMAARERLETSRRTRVLQAKVA